MNLLTSFSHFFVLVLSGLVADEGCLGSPTGTPRPVDSNAGGENKTLVQQGDPGLNRTLLAPAASRTDHTTNSTTAAPSIQRAEQPINLMPATNAAAASTNGTGVRPGDPSRSSGVHCDALSGDVDDSSDEDDWIDDDDWNDDDDWSDDPDDEDDHEEQEDDCDPGDHTLAPPDEPANPAAINQTANASSAGQDVPSGSPSQLAYNSTAPDPQTSSSTMQPANSPSPTLPETSMAGHQFTQLHGIFAHLASFVAILCGNLFL